MSGKVYGVKKIIGLNWLCLREPQKIISCCCCIWSPPRGRRKSLLLKVPCTLERGPREPKLELTQKLLPMN